MLMPVRAQLHKRAMRPRTFSHSTTRYVHAVRVDLLPALRMRPDLENSNDCKHDSGNFG
jgi:hypothetical protein